MAQAQRVGEAAAGRAAAQVPEDDVLDAARVRAALLVAVRLLGEVDAADDDAARRGLAGDRQVTAADVDVAVDHAAHLEEHEAGPGLLDGVLQRAGAEVLRLVT
ncbi:MAG: hypothetical protein IPN17_27540 [Deltaproteobacteria bacterium]|nr:hypothetical protein [Deltaproteobacteria bacterium]